MKLVITVMCKETCEYWKEWEAMQLANPLCDQD